MGSFTAMERRLQTGIVAKLGNAEVTIPAIGFRAAGVFQPNRAEAFDGMVQASSTIIQISMADMTEAARQHIEFEGDLLLDGVVYTVRNVPYPVDGFWELPVKKA